MAARTKKSAPQPPGARMPAPTVIEVTDTLDGERLDRALAQLYPELSRTRAQAAIKAGFGAGLLEDDMGTKSAKTYLVLTVGGGALDGDITGVVRGMEGVDVDDARRKAKGMKRGEERKGSKAYIMKKKEQMERQGKVVKASSKYTGRKRRIQF